MIYKSQLRSRKGNEIRTTDIYLLISGTRKDWHTTPQLRQPPSLPPCLGWMNLTRFLLPLLQLLVHFKSLSSLLAREFI